MSGRFRRCAALGAAVLGFGTLLSGTAAASGVVDHAVATTGCGQAVAGAGTSTTAHLKSGGIDREYRIYVPARYNPHRRYPLVLSFHGHKRTSQYQEELSGFSGSDQIAVYPQGLVGTDGETAWTGAPYSASADDVQFTSDLLTSLQGQLCVDPSRIYATGKSNGGGFVGVLACRMAGRFAAFAPVSGAFYPQGGACHPSRKVALLDFHGTADTTIPYTGNPAKGLPSIPDWLAGWTSRDHCFPRPLSYSPVHDVVVQRWLGCSLVHYRVEGAGHVWPSTEPNLDSETPTVIDATPVIRHFFRAHRL
ncbi:alpha/beta hydrolase family esterase [Amycolatopsis jiangsuensis]|uniref:Polyhydroxybutyrate depolymerase n=1 Tax=Amycolatopsis jiangsuensis TaxID=1181879 RepID=A0A840J4R1_9PSEU|nr:ferulic acid esterase [Amycolatopsis jiangsuensis]MBB4688427.1 polyhydroxybutyrate depolymerase [Amycolatopsis jiangsuensis]